MQNTSVIRIAVQSLVLALFLGVAMAIAQTEPSMNEVYATAKAGKLDEAQKMITQVLSAHPNSAKAHFVQSELFARQGNVNKARDALAAAEKLAPGLPFAKPEAVNSLRSELSPKGLSALTSNAPVRTLGPATAPGPSIPSWALPVLLAGGTIAAGYFIFRRRTPIQPPQPVYANANSNLNPNANSNFNPNPNASSNGLTGPQTFGSATTMQAAPGQPPASGLGGKIAGGVATGLAVGAGMMAAEALGKNLMGNHGQPNTSLDNRSSEGYQPSAANPDMGGENFGVKEGESWDDGAAADAGGGGDWDT